MDEIREVDEIEKKSFSLRIYSDQLLPWTTTCSEDGGEARATGEMYFNKTLSCWVMEYRCPKDGEIFRQWTPEIDSITKHIAERVLGKSKKDG
jgi:hypothetical protein